MANPTTYAGATVSICTTIQNVDLTVSPAPVQSASSTAATGGTIPAATYYTVITAILPSGESSASNERSILTTGATSTLTAAWTAVPNATGYNIYIGTAAGLENVKSVQANVLTATLTALPVTAGTSPAGPAASSLTYVLIGKTGQLGQYGFKTNIISYKVFDRVLDLKAKGSTDGGTLMIECATDKTDAGQNAATAAGLPSITDNYAFKITFANGDIDYVRGVVGGPEAKGGNNEAFRISQFTVGVNQLLQ